MKRFSRGGWLVLGLLFASVLGAQTPQPFSADMKTSSAKGVLSTGKIYYSAPKARMEISMQGQTLVTIYDTETLTGFTLMPALNSYLEIDLTQVKSTGKPQPSWKPYDASNPCSGLKDATCKDLGAGIADARPCEKWLIVNAKNKSTMTVWIDNALHLPIRTETSNGYVVELTNCKVGAQPEALFAVPAGYTKLSVGGLFGGAAHNQ
jgi:hypothetical protein